MATIQLHFGADDISLRVMDIITELRNYMDQLMFKDILCARCGFFWHIDGICIEYSTASDHLPVTDKRFIFLCDNYIRRYGIIH